MSVYGLNWQTVTMRFIAGLNQKADPRSLEMPELVRLIDGQFEELGGVQTRYPFGAAESADFFGGTISNARRIASNDTERLLFTKDYLWSRNVQEAKWVYRGEHLATAVDETPVFQSTEEQIDPTRAELNGTIVFAWTVSLTGGSKTYVGAKDKTTGQVKLSPTALPGNAIRPKLVALSTKILLFFADGLGNLLVYALDPASPGTALAGASTTVLGGAAFNLNYDAVREGTNDAAYVAMRRNPTVSYQVARVTAALAVTNATKARACAGPIACSWLATLQRLLVVYNSAGGNIVGDILDGSLADVTTAVAIGSTAFPVRNVACAWNQVTSTAWAFWDDNGATFSTVYRNSIDTAGTVGTPANTNYATIASGAFDHAGRVYCWYATDSTSSETDTSGATLFTAALQNCYLLYRDDGMQVAKSAWLRAGGRPGAGHITGVASPSTNKYAWCGAECRLISTDAHSFPAYADRNPLDVVVEFDTNRARRTARSGSTLYITGGMGVLQYDGIGLAELGALQFPFAFTLADGGAGSMAAGGYSYKSTLRWQNAVGETDRSTTATFKGITQAASHKVTITFDHFDHTLKRSPRANMAIEFWRTVHDAPPGAPFYLVSGVDPSVSAGNNRYIENVPGTSAATFTDNYTDTTLAAGTSDPEEGDTLESIAPPPCTLIAATDTRVFIAGIAGDPDRVWYSKQRKAGEVAAFNDGLAVAIPATGGAITGLAMLNRTLFVFRERAVYRVDGEGLDNTGGGFNYQPERIPGEVGAVSQESIAVTERGIVFKSLKGWQITNGSSIQYIGAPIADYDSEDVLAVTVMEKQHQVRILTSARMLVYDSYASEVMQRPMWSEWSVAGGLDACLWDGNHVYLTDSGPRTQLTSHTGVDYGIDLELAPVKLNDIAGYGAVDCFHLLGEFRSDCTVRVRLARDFQPTYFQDKTHTPALTAGMPLELRHSPSIRQVKALSVRITVTPTSSGEGVELTGIAFKLGVQPGLNRNLAQAAKQ